MMSQPDYVQVDHPNSIVPGASSSSHSGNRSSSGSSAGGIIENSPSSPWTIGSTEGVSLYIPPPSPATPAKKSLIDQAGVSHLSSSPSRDSVSMTSSIGDATNLHAITTGHLHQQRNRSLYHDRIFHQPSLAVEAVFAASCETMGFDIAEMWLRTGPKTHQLTNSHLRPTSLEDSVRNELIDVYYGERSSDRTHRLSPALCKRAKEAMDVVWVTAMTPHGAEALKVSISDVRTAVAIPVCHAASNTNLTVIFFSVRR
jgi:hypothetical protein